MNPQTIFFLMLFFMVFFYLFDTFLEWRNALRLKMPLSPEGKEIFDEDKYISSQKYQIQKTKFSLIQGGFQFALTILFFIFGGFGYLDTVLRNLIENPLLLSLSYFWILYFGLSILGLPFSYYFHFVLEEKFGFNKMSKKLFIFDTLKSIALTVILGGGILALIIWISQAMGNYFWLGAWILVSGISLFMMMFYTSLIVPIFNTLSPLEEGELKEKITQFGKKAGFYIDNIFVIDGSKRSTKANAYFSGFGPKKTIVLYDTLIQDITSDELVAVLAHEIGHYQHKHTLMMAIFGVIQTGLIFYLLGLTLNAPEMASVFGVSSHSFHIGLLAFSFLFTPLSLVLGLVGNVFSRKNEYQADAFAKSYGYEKELISALKKLSQNNLSHLYPDVWYEMVHYTHPNVLKRIQALRNNK